MQQSWEDSNDPIKANPVVQSNFSTVAVIAISSNIPSTVRLLLIFVEIMVIREIVNYFSCNKVSMLSHQYLTNVQSCYRRFSRQTIHPTQKFTSMNLLRDMIGSIKVSLHP